ncbi:type II secretion system F family protein [Kitasatospora sp. NPDC047058]|uniref:type II secretion system F family protein n=1 Tax=Kitasatospora sp. NPDC047058 TaxID=3155620 RepID=UPI00340FB414
MTKDQIALCWVAVLCLVASAGWCALQRTAAGVRGRRLLRLGDGTEGEGGGGPVARWGAVVAAAALRVRYGPGWLGPELLLFPAGLAAWPATGSPVPLLAAALAFLPLRSWRRRRRVAVQARQRAAAVVDLCAGLAGELRSGATPEQALHLVTARIAADREALRRLGAEPVARLAAGRYGGDVPLAFQLLAELPGGSGATAIAACWRVTADGGSGLAAGLDGVAEALRAEQALAEEITAELAAPRTTIAVLAALPAAGLLLGAALGARPLTVLLHTPAGLACLAGGAALEGLGLAWTARIVRAAARGALEAPQDPGRAEPADGVAAADDEGGWRCGLSRTRARLGRPSGSFRAEVMSA